MKKEQGFFSLLAQGILNRLNPPEIKGREKFVDVEQFTITYRLYDGRVFERVVEGYVWELGYSMASKDYHKWKEAAASNHKHQVKDGYYIDTGEIKSIEFSPITSCIKEDKYV